MVPVAATVTVNGTRLSAGTLSFRPYAAKGNQSLHHPTGDIDASGNYELVTVGRKGAPPGWYKVLVFADANAQPPKSSAHPLPPKWLVDVKYTKEETTDLTVEIAATPGPRYRSEEHTSELQSLRHL